MKIVANFDSEFESFSGYSMNIDCVTNGFDYDRLNKERHIKKIDFVYLFSIKKILALY